MRSLGIHLRALALDDVKIPISKTRLKIAVLKWYLGLLGGNELKLEDMSATNKSQHNCMCILWNILLDDPHHHLICTIWLPIWEIQHLYTEKGPSFKPINVMCKACHPLFMFQQLHSSWCQMAIEASGSLYSNIDDCEKECYSTFYANNVWGFALICIYISMISVRVMPMKGLIWNGTTGSFSCITVTYI